MLPRSKASFGRLRRVSGSCATHVRTFELTDAVLLTRNAYSLAGLSLCPVFRRRWPSIYEAVQDTRPQRHKLMRLYIQLSAYGAHLLLTQTKLTPGRVAQAMGGVLAMIATPAQPPTPRGKSPEWPEGQPRQRITRYPVVKKSTNKEKNRLSKSA